jgi:hypothetical protein
MGRIVGALLCVGMLALALVGISNTSSCYSPPNPTCGFLCTVDNSFACPDEYTCQKSSGVCLANSATTTTRCYADATPLAEGIDADPTPPQVTGTSPMNGDTGVARGVPIVISFSQQMQGFNMSTVQVTDGATPVGITTSFTTDTNRLFITPIAPEHGGSTITVSLLAGITNTEPIHVPLAPFSFSFVTVDDEPPMLVLSSPLDGDTAIATTQPIVLTFSEPVVGVDAAITISSGAGTATPNGDDTVWTFTPTTPYTAASLVTVSLSAAIKDLANNALAPTSFSFTTQ